MVDSQRVMDGDEPMKSHTIRVGDTRWQKYLSKARAQGVAVSDVARRLLDEWYNEDVPVGLREKWETDSPGPVSDFLDGLKGEQRRAAAYYLVGALGYHVPFSVQERIVGHCAEFITDKAVNRG
jgi:hypothetical protein